MNDEGVTLGIVVGVFFGSLLLVFCAVFLVSLVRRCRMAARNQVEPLGHVARLQAYFADVEMNRQRAPSDASSAASEELPVAKQ